MPDISANAGVYETFYDSGWMAVGGTSIASPKLAGIAADIAQGSKAGSLGDFAPKLAALAAEHVYGTALTDVKTGINWTSLAVESTGKHRPHPHARRGCSAPPPGSTLRPASERRSPAGLACPQIFTMTPSRGKAGTRVTLHGIGLERATIKFGSRNATVVSAGSKSAVVVVPKGSGTVDVSGTDPMGTGARPALFTYRSS